MSRPEQSLEQCLIKGIGAEVAHIASRGHDSIQGADLEFVEIAHRCLCAARPDADHCTL